MKKDIILAGVGGQGILSIAASIGLAAVDEGLFLKQAEVHGMSQRGGDVQSHLRLSDKEIASDLIGLGNADLIISVEPMESLRYLPYLNQNGWLITNTKPFINIPNYPDISDIINEIKKLSNKIYLDADEMAMKLKSSKSANMVILGASVSFLDIKYESIKNAVKKLFISKGEKVIESNLTALDSGKEFAEKFLK